MAEIPEDPADKRDPAAEAGPGEARAPGRDWRPSPAFWRAFALTAAGGMFLLAAGLTVLTLWRAPPPPVPLLHVKLGQEIPGPLGRAQDSAGPDAALPSAPIEGLAATGPNGLVLPQRREDGLTPFNAYRKPFTPAEGVTPVAVVVRHTGLSDARTRQVVETLPGTATLAFSPYGDDLAALNNAARAAGHEVWMEVPVQPRPEEGGKGTDRGPLALSGELSFQESRERLDRTMAALPHMTGLIFEPMSSDYVAGSLTLPGMLEEIGTRGLGTAFLSAQRPQGGDLPYLVDRPFHIVPSDLRPEELDQLLADLAVQARAEGSMIVYIDPPPAALENLAGWITSMEDEKLQAVPLSALAQ